MKATELRISNYVGATFPGNQLPEMNAFDAACYNANGFAPYRISSGTDIDNAHWYFPIPITEEWLVKFGAVSTFQNWQFTISVGAISLHFRRNNEWYSELGGIYLGSKIQYVHQLQNLYFALTGNELELK